MRYEPDAGPNPGPLPDGGLPELAGCVFAGGAVAFTSACPSGATVTASAQAGVVTDAGTFCNPGDGSSVSRTGDDFIIQLSTQGSSCQLGIARDVAPDAGARFTWEETPRCSTLLPIKGTVEVATTDPNTCTGGDC